MSNGDSGNVWERESKLTKMVGKMLLDGTRRVTDFNDILQDFVTNPRWSIREEIITPTVEAIEPQEKFVQIADLGVMEVPAWYVHHTQLEWFRRKYREKLHACDDRVTDRYFKRASVRLVPGRRLHVTVVEATTQFTSMEALSYLRARKSVLVGAQGVTLAYELLKDLLPKSLLLLISFDEEHALWHDSQGAEVPYMMVCQDTNPTILMDALRIGGFKTAWGRHRLIRFSDPATS